MFALIVFAAAFPVHKAWAGVGIDAGTFGGDLVDSRPT